MNSKKIIRDSFTAYPNRYTDHIKPTLTDTQRDICDVVVRLTYGWHRSAARISNSTFILKTNKSERAIITAKKQLMDMGILIMEDKPRAGRPALYSLDLYYDDPKRSRRAHQEMLQETPDNTNNGSCAPSDDELTLDSDTPDHPAIKSQEDNIPSSDTTIVSEVASSEPHEPDNNSSSSILDDDMITGNDDTYDPEVSGNSTDLPTLYDVAHDPDNDTCDIMDATTDPELIDHHTSGNDINTTDDDTFIPYTTHPTTDVAHDHNNDTCDPEIPTTPPSDIHDTTGSIHEITTDDKPKCAHYITEVSSVTGPIYSDLSTKYNKQIQTPAAKRQPATGTQAGIRAVCYNFTSLFPEAKGDNTWRFIGWAVASYGQDKCIEKLEYLREYRKLHPIVNPAGLFRVALVKDYQPSRWITGMIKARRKAEAEYQKGQAMLADMEAAKANVNWEAGQAALANIMKILDKM